MLHFIGDNVRWLGAGFMLTFASAFGQTWFISLFAGFIKDASHVGALYVALGFIGLTQGTASALWGVILPVVYGTRHLGSVRSLVTTVMVIATAIGPGVTGILIDWGVSFLARSVFLGAWCVGLSVFCYFIQQKLARELSAEPVSPRGSDHGLPLRGLEESSHDVISSVGNRSGSSEVADRPMGKAVTAGCSRGAPRPWGLGYVSDALHAPDTIEGGSNAHSSPRGHASSPHPPAAASRAEAQQDGAAKPIGCAAYRPCSSAFLFPFGAPGELPPCILQRPFGMAGPWQGRPPRAAAHRRLSCLTRLRYQGSLSPSWSSMRVNAG